MSGTDNDAMTTLAEAMLVHKDDFYAVPYFLFSPSI